MTRRRPSIRATWVTATNATGRVMLMDGFTRPFGADSVAACHGPRFTGGRSAEEEIRP